MKINVCLTCLVLVSCAETTKLPSGTVITSVSDFPDYTDRSAIVGKLGYPAEVVVHGSDRLASKSPSFDWVYYLKSSKHGVVRFVYTFREGKWVRSTYLTVEKGDSLRVLDSNDESDLRIILSEKRKLEVTNARLDRE
jgi:hypothetical protein